ncbi:hypothetical protein U1Q18_048106 [Sarracenia purpurea var. burkii]
MMAAYQIPESVALRLPEFDERACSLRRDGEIFFTECAFQWARRGSQLWSEERRRSERGASSHPRRILVGGEGGPATGLVSNPAAAIDRMAPPMTDTLAVLTLFDEARLGAELIGRALSDWDKLMLRDLLPNPAVDQYWQGVGRVRTLIPVWLPFFLSVPFLTLSAKCLW